MIAMGGVDWRKLQLLKRNSTKEFILVFPETFKAAVFLKIDGKYF